MSDTKRVLRIRVSDSGGVKANITLPLGLAKLARIGGITKMLKKEHDIDVEELLDVIEDMDDGKVLNVVEDRKGEHVEIFVETKVGSKEVASV